MQEPPARIWAWEGSVFWNYWTPSSGEGGVEYVHAQRVDNMLQAGDAFLSALRASRETPDRELLPEAYQSFVKAVEDIRTLTSEEDRLPLLEKQRAQMAREQEAQIRAAKQLAQEQEKELRRVFRRGIIVGALAGTLIVVTAVLFLRHA